MLTHERLNKFLAKRCRAIRRQVNEFCSTHDSEALHLLRVEVKKLRACLALLKAATPEEPLRAKGLREVYKAAGCIRTAHINLDILDKLKLENVSFRQDQQRAIAEGTAAFCQNARHFRQKIRGVQEKLLASTHDVKSGKVKNLFSDRTQKLSAFFSAGALGTEGLHEARKEVKELMYIQDLLPAALSTSLGVNKDYLDELQHKIGDWHDTTVTLSLLQGFGHTDPGVINELQKAEATRLQAIKDLTAGFDEKIHAAAIEAVKVGS